MKSAEHWQKNKVLYITDLDGTLLNEEMLITEASREMINQVAANKDVYFSIATARSLPITHNLLAGLNVTAPIVLMNGACVYDLKKQEYLYIHGFEIEESIAVLEAFLEEGVLPRIYAFEEEQLHLYHMPLAKDNAYNRREILMAQEDPYWTLMETEKMHDIAAEKKATYIASIQKGAVAEKIYAKLLEIEGVQAVMYASTYDEDAYFIDVFPKKADKAAGVTFLKEQLGVKTVVAFGDNHNDSAMFAAADRAYAVENAIPALKALATAVVGAFNEEGVAKAMLRDYETYYVK
ncbi:MAG: HAD-IIB family hydrolase [Christensenellaceae bacterium]|jgi:Cof subfamily protein (haloacid dehalogenase superfamily)